MDDFLGRYPLILFLDWFLSLLNLVIFKGGQDGFFFPSPPFTDIAKEGFPYVCTHMARWIPRVLFFEISALFSAPKSCCFGFLFMLLYFASFPFTRVYQEIGAADTYFFFFF